MDERPVPYRKMVFVCVNERADGRVACANPGRGGDALCAALKEAVKAAGLKKQVRVARSGCLDLCAEGPNAVVFPEGAVYSGLRPEDAPELLKRLLP